MKVTYKNVIGLNILTDTSTNINGASLVGYEVLKPVSNEEVFWEGEVYKNTYIRYKTLENDLDEVGIYKIQPYIEIDEFKGYGEPFEIIVKNKFE